MKKGREGAGFTLIQVIPFFPPGFDIRRYSRIRMIVDFSTTGYHTCSFEALGSSGGGTVDLGLAFVALPDELWPVVGVASRETNTGGGDGTSLEMQYHSGPESRCLTFVVGILNFLHLCH